MPEFERLDIPLDCLGATGGDGARLVTSLRRLMRKRAVDVVHTHNLDPWMHAGLAVLWPGGPRLVHTEHSFQQFYTRKKWVVAGRVLGRISDMVIAVSADVATFLRDRLRVPTSQLRLVYNGVDPDRFNPERSNGHAADFRAMLGLQRTDRVVAVVARLVPIKNHDLLFDAFRRVSVKLPHARLLVVGDGPLRGMLEARAVDLGLTDSIRFLGERHDIPELLSACDLFVLPSVSEGCSIALLEAMAAGLPVVCTRVGGNTELVEDGRTGLVVPSQDAVALAAALSQLLADHALRARMGQEGRDRVLRHFNLAETARQYESIYNQVLHGDHRR